MTDSTPARDRFFELLTAAIHDGTLAKLTLGKYRGDDATLRNLFVRPIALKAGPHLSLVWRHATRDLTQNLPPAEALEKLRGLIGQTFLDAHLFTAEQTAQLQCEPQGRDRLAIHAATGAAPATSAAAHDRTKQYLIPADRPWLRDLGVTNPHGQPRAEMAHKFRQIQKFAELVRHLLTEAGIEGQPEKPLRIVDMGCGKGYLTFSVAELLGDRAEVVGIELRPGLVEECNALAKKHELAGLRFEAGSNRRHAAGSARRADRATRLRHRDRRRTGERAPGRRAPAAGRALLPEGTAPAVAGARGARARAAARHLAGAPRGVCHRCAPRAAARMGRLPHEGL